MNALVFRKTIENISIEAFDKQFICEMKRLFCSARSVGNRI